MLEIYFCACLLYTSADLRRKINQAKLRVREKLDAIIKSPTQSKYLQETLVTMRDGRFVVPVKSEHRSEIKGLVHDTSASGAKMCIRDSHYGEKIF